MHTYTTQCVEWDKRFERKAVVEDLHGVVDAAARHEDRGGNHLLRGVGGGSACVNPALHLVHSVLLEGRVAARLLERRKRAHSTNARVLRLFSLCLGKNKAVVALGHITAVQVHVAINRRRGCLL